MYGTLATECGYTFAEIRQMTLHDVACLNTHWRKNPPLTVLVRAIAQGLGLEIKVEEPQRYMTADEARRHLAATGGRIPGVGSL